MNPLRIKRGKIARKPFLLIVAYTMFVVDDIPHKIFVVEKVRAWMSVYVFTTRVF